jgi:hypothetical protein
MIRKLMLGLVGGLVALGVSVSEPTPAQAGATIHFGFGFGAPYYGGYYAPAPRYYRERRYYRPRYVAPACWTERRRVVKYNRYGEPYYAVRRVRVCH